MYDVEKGMLCSLCKDFKMSGRNGLIAWAGGGFKTLRLDKVKEHEKGSKHLDALKLQADLERSKTMSDQLVEMQSNEVKTIAYALKAIYWLIKRSIAHTTNFESLIELVIDLGCKELQNLKIAKNATHTSEQTLQEFIFCLSQVIEEDILKEMADSPALALMVDESTDISVLNQLVLYGRTLSKGCVRSRFLSIRDLFDGKAHTIVKAVKEYLETARLCPSNVDCFGSDGASVMVGKRNGVATKLREDNPSMLSIHCINHRLALATKDAFSEIPYLKKYEQVMMNLYKFYHNSAVRMSGLAQIQKLLDDPQIKLKKPIHVR